MSDTLDKLEIRIGKFLDRELSPQERGLLETELQRDRHAKELFEQMRLLHECSCGVVTHEVLGQGADPAEVFERAWQQNKRSFWRGIARGGLRRDGSRWGARADGYLRFAVGVAAGLLLGLALHFVPLPPSQTPSTTPTQPLVAVDVPSGRSGQIEMGSGPQVHDSALGSPSQMRNNGFRAPVVSVRSPGDPGRTTREVDWYVYTDRAGNQWLIEGTHEGMVKPAVYRDGL
jgi:hypothetical protein